MHRYRAFATGVESNCRSFGCRYDACLLRHTRYDEEYLSLHRTELVWLVASLALVALAITPLFGGAREGSERAGCFNNLRQLGVAALKYVDEHDDNFPRRQMPAWPEQFRSHYRSISVLACPTDGPFPGTSVASTNLGDRAPRSYLLNGWSDYYNGVPPRNPFPASAIQEPAGTIIFGEKVTESTHFWMDYS